MFKCSGTGERLNFLNDLQAISQAKDTDGSEQGQAFTYEYLS